ncbi:hypothetical protein MRX96_046774 [Rhipicephalus microplus]
MEGGDGASEDGSSDVPWTPRDQADHYVKKARERSRQMELELELAKLRPASPSGSVSDAGGTFERCSNTEWRKYAKLLNCPHYLERLAPNPSASEGNDKLTARVCLDKVTPADRLWKVTLNCKDKSLNAIVDTGAEITVVQESVVPDEFIQDRGRVSLREAFGERVEVKLVELPLTLKQGQPVFAEVSQATPVLCAVTDKLSVSECLLSASDWTALQKSQCEYNEQDPTLSPPKLLRRMRGGRKARWESSKAE